MFSPRCGGCRQRVDLFWIDGAAGAQHLLGTSHLQDGCCSAGKFACSGIFKGHTCVSLSHTGSVHVLSLVVENTPRMEGQRRDLESEDSREMTLGDDLDGRNS